MKLTKRLCLLWSVGLLCSAAMLWAGPWGGGSSDYDYYDRPDHSDSSSSSSAPITALALQNTMFGAASRAEAGARYAATISCRQETERADAHHARSVLVFQFRLVDLQTAEVLLTLVEKVDRGWRRGVF